MSFALLAAGARMIGIPIHVGARLREIDAVQGAVRGVTFERGGRRERVACDGVVFTGNWLPEVAALAGSAVAIDPATGGPEIDQALRTSSPGVFAAGNMLHGVETSGWCAREGRHAGEMIARFLRTEITGVQGGARFVLSGEIAYLVPQRWDAAVAVAPVAPTLRLNRDLGSGSVRLQCGSDEVWMGSPGPLLRRRRIRLALDALSPAAPGSQQLAVSVR